ncbi:MFS transporter [Agromyces laixinhei]|uniref:MFS transporter n=1 Tax=Agromyces laixinhei TaxID=2585717 RepID=UPI0012EE0C9E|nr:MFS transporter [Agromyces laixinhei]
MLLRRALYRWQMIAVVVLPVWLAVGWAVFGGGGWGTLGLVIVVPVAFVVLGVVVLLTNVRPTVRHERALSWIDVGVLTAWQLAIIGTGFYGASATLFGVLAILLGIAAFWVAVWQLVTDGANRMKASMAEFERLAGQQQGGAASGASPGSTGRKPGPAGPGVRRPPFDDGGDDVIIIHETRD